MSFWGNLEKAGGVTLTMSSETARAIDVSSRRILNEAGEAAYDALAPVAAVALTPLALLTVAGERVAGFGGKARVRASLMLAAFGFSLLACRSAAESTIPPTPVKPVVSEIAPPPTEVAESEETVSSAEPTPSIISTETPFVSYAEGGDVNEEELLANENIQKQMTAWEGWGALWKENLKFGEATTFSFVPVYDQKYPGDLDHAILLAEVHAPGDNSWDGYFASIPAQMLDLYINGDPERGIQPRDINQLLPPADGTYLDALQLSRVVKQGSVPAENGVPIDAVLRLNGGQIVYMAGSADNLKVVGDWDENYQWEVVVELPELDLSEKVVSVVEQALRGYKVVNGNELADANGNILPNYRIVPIKSDTSFVLVGNREFSLDGQDYKYQNILTVKDLVVTKDGGLDMQGERFVDGALSNQERLDENGNVIEGECLYAYNDVIAALEQTVAEDGLREGEETADVARELFGFRDTNATTIQYNGQELKIQSRWTGSDDLTIVGEDGNTIKHIRTNMYAFIHTLDNNAIVAFRRNGEIVRMMVDGPIKLGSEMKKIVLNPVE